MLCLGSSHCTSYAELFDVADISISIQSVEEFFCPRGTFTTELSVADLEFNDALIGLSCDITLPSNTHRRRGHSLRATLDLVQEGRRLLLNICQLMAFSISVTSTLVLFMICSQILPIRVPPTFHSTNVFWIQILMTMFVSLPMLAFGADPNTLTQPSCKNNADESDHTSARRCVFFVAARTIPTVLFCTVVFYCLQFLETSGNVCERCLNTSTHKKVVLKLAFSIGLNQKIRRGVAADKI